MVVLGIETATSVLSVALLKDKKILSEYSQEASRNHSSLLLPFIKTQLKKSKLKLSDINLIAVSKGPGSFTGLRVGISVSKGLGFSLNIPVIAVPTLDGLARRVINGDCSRMGNIPIYICPILDAKKNQIYFALYKSKNNRLEILTEYFSLEFNDMCDVIDKVRKEHDKYDILFTGSDVSMYKLGLKERFGESAYFAEHKKQLANAVSVAEIGIEKFKKGEVDSIYDLKPLYIRKPDVKYR